MPMVRRMAMSRRFSVTTMYMEESRPKAATMTMRQRMMNMACFSVCTALK